MSKNKSPRERGAPQPTRRYRHICQLVTSGQLADAEQIVKAANLFWAGVEDWAAANQIGIVRQLEDLI